MSLRTIDRTHIQLYGYVLCDNVLSMMDGTIGMGNQLSKNSSNTYIYKILTMLCRGGITVRKWCPLEVTARDHGGLCAHILA